jgi:hypothetical protein
MPQQVSAQNNTLQDINTQGQTCVTLVALSCTSAALIAAAPIASLPVRPTDHGCRVLQQN